MAKRDVRHPYDSMVRSGSLPSEWCPGCGIGIAVGTFVQSVLKSGRNRDKITLVSSGLGCTGRIAEYLNFRMINAGDKGPVAAALREKESHPENLTVMFLSDIDFITGGVDAFLEACRAQKKLLAFYVNGFLYSLLYENKKIRPIRFKRHIAPSVSQNPFNMPHLMNECGACYIARWTPLHCRRLGNSIRQAMETEGFSFIEILSPCLMYLAAVSHPEEKLDRMAAYLKNSEIRNDAPTRDLEIHSLNRIVVGRFVNR